MCKDERRGKGTKMTKLSETTIEAYEAKGAKRWTKGNHDRLYINAELLGLECEYYNTGNVRSATWCGEGISNADARRLKASKVFVDVATGELSVRTEFGAYGMPSVEERAQEFSAAAQA